MVFTKNRDQLFEPTSPRRFLARVVAQAQAKGLTSDEHFTVDGTLLEALGQPEKAFSRRRASLLCPR